MVEIKLAQGDYVVYNYGIQDREDEGWALALYQLKEDKLKEVYHPGNYHLGDNQSVISSEDNERLFEFLKGKNIKQIYTIHHTKEFYGISGKCLSMHEPDENIDTIELWQEWKSIDKDGVEHRSLKEQGIEVIFHYDFG